MTTNPITITYDPSNAYPWGITIKTCNGCITWTYYARNKTRLFQMLSKEMESLRDSYPIQNNKQGVPK